MKARNVIIGVIFILVGIYFIAKAGHTRENCDRVMVRKDFVGYSSRDGNGSLIGGVVLVIIGGGLVFFSKDRKSRKRK